MSRRWKAVVSLGMLVALVVGLAVAVPASAEAQQGADAGPQLGHMVFFTLKERTKENREKLAALCREHLDGHAGTVHFSVGTLAEDFDREVNDREWDVALHLVFADRAAHDKYQEHPRHLKFIEEGKDMWAKVRVFDSYIPAKKK